MGTAYKNPTPLSWGLNNSLLGASIASQNKGDTPPLYYKIWRVAGRLDVYGGYIFLDPPPNFGPNKNKPSDGLPQNSEIWIPTLQDVNQAMGTYYKDAIPAGEAMILLEDGSLVPSPAIPGEGMAGYVDDPLYGAGIPVAFRLIDTNSGIDETSNNFKGAADGKPGDYVRALEDGTLSLVKKEAVDIYTATSAKNYSVYQYWFGIA